MEKKKEKKKTVFNRVKLDVQRADELRRGRFRACRRGSWNLAAIHRARLEHKRPAKEGLAFRFSRSSEEGRMARSELQARTARTACMLMSEDLNVIHHPSS